MKYATGVITNLTIIAIVAVLASMPLVAQQSQQSAQSKDPTTTTSTKTTDEAKIRQVLLDQVAAWNAGDLEAFMQTYWKSPKLTFSSGGKTTRGWQATLDRYKTSYATREKMGTLRFDQLQVTLLSDDVALVLGRWHLTTSDGKPQGNFSLVIQRVESAWKIVHDHSSTLEPETGDLQDRPESTDH